MVAPPSWLATAAAFLPLLSIANAELSQELRDRKLPDCKANTRYSEIEDMGTFWYDSGAEQFANDYINSQTDHTRWAQNLMRELLDTNDYTKFDCETTGATCSTADELCGKLNEVNKGGLFYLFISLRNFHTYMTKLDTELNKSFFQNALAVSQIQELLNIPSGQGSDSVPDILSILSSAAGIAAGFAGPAGGVVGAASGVFSIMGSYGPSEDPVDFKDKSQAETDKMIGDIMTSMNKYTSKLVAAVFGTQFQSQDIIPEVMRRGGVDNPAVSVFGWGEWLREDSRTVEAERFAEHFKDKINQSLLWQMGRHFKKLYVVLGDDIDKEECNGPHITSVWDDEKDRCLDLFSWDTGAKSTLGGANDVIENGMWEKWNMDPYWTMRNAVECWEEHNGHIGDANPSQYWESTVPPPCFFPMEVVKGSYSDASKGLIKLDGNYQGQYGLGGMNWPKKKCDAGTAFQRDPTTCKYSWVGDE